MIKEKNGFSKPFIFVSSKNFPKISIGPGFYKDYENAKKQDPKKWIKYKDEKEIDNYRKNQQFSFKMLNKKDAIKNTKEITELKLLTQAKNVAEIEMQMQSKKKLIIEKEIGISNIAYDFEKFKIINNIKISNHIEKITSQGDIKASEAIKYLFKKKEDVYKIQQILSSGSLGINNQKIFVPTKFAITAVDDILSKNILEKTINYNPINEYRLYKFDFYKNKFYIIFMPFKWNFEMMEGTEDIINNDYELNFAKKEYANNVTGAYYATRLEINKYLEKEKRTASVLVIRDIEKGYESKGVWVIRESIKCALLEKPEFFKNIEELKTYLDQIYKIRNKSNFWFEKSNILKNALFQKRISNYFNK
ncbi:MAG: hypothetical protein PHR26_01120 [Candidatus ainarchaeum sp.]|nr:hypothetical protein [Candidatus ainarchaeum sp.]MDD3976003.1 hypothetical protein [Candidatus ainarchaeum sp.]